ncbi:MULTISPECIES: DUF2147 domain-containing protein [unclassified Rhizobium]|jgi:uncharacterized protein (DUF2147 family)|uniref:DUF2147 domain-containing protein n=1 Tax=unclassified Rhizobium TaxID=2613769 RepID=UPI000362E5F9|nr:MULTISPECIES: DUF2147 domain-containing protein [unclassified Rhizobium]MBD9446662.1 DUF2147 domain-containing protein [Rhizobium sp. RHZ01]MBD9453652.1 DUF2147 domain-containing protein [Rhizobium sp. RHZ02]NMN72594.1 uncharacterized protein (DUF2147 family) [Rhizobium sp. 57MFTsu3.2]
MRIAVLTTYAALISTAAVQAQQSADPSGIWLRDDGNARVRIAPCGSNICATNLWIRDTTKGEEAGDRLVMSLQPKSSDTLAGTAYDPKRDRTFSVTVRVSDKSLLTRGCILGGLLCKNVRWQPSR